MTQPLLNTQRDLETAMEHDSTELISPYGKSWTRWIVPVMFVAFLANFDQEAIFATFTVIALFTIHLPVTLLKTKWKPFRRERLLRFGIYLIGAALSSVIYAIDKTVAMDRAEHLIAAIDLFRGSHKRYPETIEELDLVKSGAIPLEPCIIRACGKFRYKTSQLEDRASLEFSESILLYNSRMYGFSPGEAGSWLWF